MTKLTMDGQKVTRLGKGEYAKEVNLTILVPKSIQELM